MGERTKATTSVVVAGRAEESLFPASLLRSRTAFPRWQLTAAPLPQDVGWAWEGSSVGDRSTQ